MVRSANNAPLIDCSQLPNAKHHHVGYSGGADSTALLHALSLIPELSGKITAHHINHRLQPESDDWEQHCLKQCEAWNIPLIVSRVDLGGADENSARNARYQAIAGHMDLNQDWLHTAHHLDDQIETVLFRLLRGSGLTGLTGIKASSETVGNIRCHRPLLDTTKSALLEYLKQHQLKWIEDPSNQSLTYSRNQIRHQIIPAINSANQKAAHQIEQSRQNLLASETLIQHLVAAKNPHRPIQTTDANLLSTWLYHWLHGLGLDAPHHRQLLQFSIDCLSAGADKTPKLATNAYAVMHWQKQMHVIQTLPQPHQEDITISVTQATQNITLPPGYGSISLKADQTQKLTIRFQQTGQRIVLAQNGMHHKLKKLFQQHRIPPWQRFVMPYLYDETELIAVGNQIRSKSLEQLIERKEIEYRWHSPAQLL